LQLGCQRRALLALACASLALPAAAAGRVLQVPTREGVTTTLYWEPADHAQATVLLFPGGGGGFGRVEGGRATSNNFLVRSAALFVERGFNVAIRLQDRVAGLVLTSSVVSHKRTGAVPTQDLAALRLPVLVLHHERDACPICAPQDVPAILRGLVNAPVKQQIFVSRGAAPQGEPCGALHWHGYIGLEREVVDTIAAWMAAKTPR